MWFSRLLDITRLLKRRVILFDQLVGVALCATLEKSNSKVFPHTRNDLDLENVIYITANTISDVYSSFYWKSRVIARVFGALQLAFEIFPAPAVFILCYNTIGRVSFQNNSQIVWSDFLPGRATYKYYQNLLEFLKNVE